MAFSTKKKPSGKTNVSAKVAPKLPDTNSSSKKNSTYIRPQSK